MEHFQRKHDDKRWGLGSCFFLQNNLRSRGCIVARPGQTFVNDTHNGDDVDDLNAGNRGAKREKDCSLSSRSFFDW